MKRNPRYALLFALFAVGSLLALGYAPAASTQIEKNSNPRQEKHRIKPGLRVKQLHYPWKTGRAAANPTATTSL
jgi:Tfp pilus assembly protein PilO